MKTDKPKIILSTNSVVDNKMIPFEKGILIIGNARTGKSRLAESFCTGLESASIISARGSKNIMEDKFFFQSVSENTKIIVIDDYIFGKGGFESLYTIIQYGVAVNKMLKSTFIIRPKIIVTCDCNMSDIKSNKLLKRFFNVFELKGCLK